MGILARGGFSFDLSKRVLDLEKTEFNKLIKNYLIFFFFLLQLKYQVFF